MDAIYEINKATLSDYQCIAQQAETMSDNKGALYINIMVDR